MNINNRDDCAHVTHLDMTSPISKYWFDEEDGQTNGTGTDRYFSLLTKSFFISLSLYLSISIVSKRARKSTNLHETHCSHKGEIDGSTEKRSRIIGVNMHEMKFDATTNTVVLYDKFDCNDLCSNDCVSCLCSCYILTVK